MDANTLFFINANRWTILKAVTDGHTTPTRIAKQTKLSLAYVGQQLQLLEAHGLLQSAKTKPQKKGPGKPAHQYRIGQDCAFVLSLQEHNTQLQLSKQNKTILYPFYLNLGSDLDNYFFRKLYFLHEDILQTVDLLALLGNDADKTHLLAITPNIEAFRKEHSTIILKSPGGQTRTYIIWSHTQPEIEEGLAKQEAYYREKIQKARVIWERGGTRLTRFQEQLQQPST